MARKWDRSINWRDYLGSDREYWRSDSAEGSRSLSNTVRALAPRRCHVVVTYWKFMWQKCEAETPQNQLCLQLLGDLNVWKQRQSQGVCPPLLQGSFTNQQCSKWRKHRIWDQLASAQLQLVYVIDVWPEETFSFNSLQHLGKWMFYGTPRPPQSGWIQ